MFKIIRHGNTIHTYKCIKCGCIFIASEIENKIEDIDGLLHCPECGYYISEDDIIDDQKINQETINVPSCWKAGEHDKKYEATNTFATIDSSKKDGFTFGTTFDK